ncbi:MAG: hypothetical protein LQ349_007366 [Xanthoria aureola]|nr:MAG: hypothetical protein LQ349_007366 [Xanthoria aureola]
MSENPEVDLSLDDTIVEPQISTTTSKETAIFPDNPKPTQSRATEGPDANSILIDVETFNQLVSFAKLGKQVAAKTAVKALKSESKPRQDTRDTVVYKVRYKDSVLDKQWEERFLDESDYEKQKAFGDTILEMSKDVLLSEKAQPGEDLKISSITEESMTIHSPYLIDIMPQLVGYYPASKSSESKLRAGHQALTILKPYRMLGGARPNLMKLREEYESDLSRRDPSSEDEDVKRKRITVKHIERLERELDKVLAEPMRLEFDGYGQTPPVASFDMLWLLFRPGTEVYTVINEETVCCRVLTPVWETLNTRVPCTMELRMWFLDFNGTHVDRRRHNVRIDSFDGKREILSLEAYPVIYSKDKALRGKLVDRGKKYMTFLRYNAPQCQHKGFAFAKQDNDKGMRERHHYDGRVVVDPVFDYMEHGAPYNRSAWLDKADIWPSKTNDGSMNKFVNIDPKDCALKLEDSHHVLISGYIQGFTLGTRKRGMPATDLIDNLEIDPEDLNMIKASVPHLERRQRGDPPKQDPARIDPIAGKGQGQIMLLHGPPGTGKTFTAECLAEYSERPLLRLSTGELGLEPSRLEEKLWKWFRIAEEWQAVLLIDEADVYLEQRGIGASLERDAIVAGKSDRTSSSSSAENLFLRSLEYYRGILFLTSNSVRKFDEAILSRVLLVIGFKNLETIDRKRLRLHYQEKIQKENGNRYEILRGARESLEKIDQSDYVYNGREIKNVFQMALALATEDGRKSRQAGERISVNDPHVSMVMKRHEDFIDYQKRQSGGSRDKIANDNGWRLFP